MNKYKPYFEDKGHIKQQLRVSTPAVSNPAPPTPKRTPVNIVSPTEQTVMQAKAKVKRAGKRKYPAKKNKGSKVAKRSRPATKRKGRSRNKKRRKKTSRSRSKVDIFDDVV